jgi:hypothetical protein
MPASLNGRRVLAAGKIKRPALIAQADLVNTTLNITEPN